MRKKTDRERYLVKEEFSALLKASSTDIRAYMLFYLIGNLGLRVGEAIRLRPTDISFKKLSINIPTLKQGSKKEEKGTIKRGELPKVYKEIPITESMKDKLNRFLSIDHTYLKVWLFQEADGLHLPDWKAKRWFKMYARKAGLNKYYSIHALRHYKGNQIYSTFKDIVAVKEGLRHRSINSSQIYVNLNLEDKRKFLEKLEEVE